mgnify:CR=1 FL=1
MAEMKDCGKEHPAIKRAPYIYPELWTMWFYECLKCQKALKERVMKNQLKTIFSNMRIVDDTYYNERPKEPTWTMPPPCHTCIYGILQPLEIGHRIDCLLPSMEKRDTQWYHCYLENHGQMRVGAKPELDRSEVTVECEDCRKTWKALKYYVEDKYKDGRYLEDQYNCPYCRIGR